MKTLKDRKSLKHIDSPYYAVNSLMRGQSSSMSSMPAQMTGLATCGMDTKQQLHFPLSQRRKRRVLFTQAQVGLKELNQPKGTVYGKVHPAFIDRIIGALFSTW